MKPARPKSKTPKPRPPNRAKGVAHYQRELATARRATSVAQAARTRFLAVTSHEIRTPLNAIIGMADMLWETALTPEQRQYVRVFRSAGENLLRLIEDILDTSRMQRGRLKLDTHDFNLADVVEAACEVMALPAHRKRIELDYMVAPNVPVALVGDSSRLRQILINLVGNAIKFTESGGVTVEVKAMPPDASARPGRCRVRKAPGIELLFSVADTGIGIPADKRDAIFDVFTQVDSTTTRRHGGTGLGLSITRQLVRLMGGDVWVESEVDKGSTFYFTARFARQETTDTAAVDRPHGIDNLRVLVVDDNAFNRMLVKQALVTLGAQVGEAWSGEQCIHELQIARNDGACYDVMVLDHTLGHSTGVDVVKAMRLCKADPRAVLVMLTLESRAEIEAQYRGLGIDRFIMKPVRQRHLLEAVMAVSQNAMVGAKPARTAPPAQTPGEPVLNLLVAEDAPDNQFLLQSFLKGHTVDLAENGREAVDLFAQGAYDAVLMDMHMPQMDGYEATRAIRGLERKNGRHRTPILALTAYAYPDELRASVDAGCDACLTKPIHRHELVRALAFWCSDKHKAAPGKQAASPPSPPAPAAAAGDRILVRPDAALLDLVPEFIERRWKDVAELKDALLRRAFDTVSTIGHIMKGCGGTYGFDDVTHIGGAIEQAAGACNASVVGECIARLEDYLGRVEVANERSGTTTDPVH